MHLFVDRSLRLTRVIASVLLAGYALAWQSDLVYAALATGFLAATLVALPHRRVLAKRRRN